MAKAKWFFIVLTLLLFGAPGYMLAEENQPRQKRPTERGFGDLNLVGGLQATPGCLGVETARTASGKQVIFAWFENKKACLNWYYSETHQRAQNTFFPNRQATKPLAGVPDDVGPIMAIASLTMAKPGASGLTQMPVSQTSIELYKPLKSGIFYGRTFAPVSLKVPGMVDYTPKKRE